MKSWLKLMLVAATATVLAACGSDDDDSAPVSRPGTLAEVATSAGFGALVAAADKAGLVAALSDPNADLTVFAPTDEAFAKVPKDQLDALLKDKAKLTAVLTYHVVPGKVMAADVKAGKVKTVQGGDITVTTTGGVKVDAANVVKTDIVADNGVIHVIDSVIMPK